MLNLLSKLLSKLLLSTSPEKIIVGIQANLTNKEICKVFLHKTFIVTEIISIDNEHIITFETLNTQ